MENREAAIEWFSMLKEKFVKTEYGGYLDMAISALEQQEQDRWIPVMERLPEKDDFVLVTISGETSNGKSWEHTMTLAVWTGDSWDLTDADMTDFRIFAWRPLSEPYTEEKA